MHKLFSLGSRLQKCAAFVRPGARVADIGTDHGYLPIWLMKSGHASQAIAADIGEGPLKSAQANAKKYEAELTTVLSDGFDKINPDAFDDAVIAGMGGELIIKIIAKAAFLKDGQKKLILQPMTSAPELRQYLSDNGFQLECEEAVKDDSKLYSVMRAVYNREASSLKDLKIYMGKIYPYSEFSREYAESVVKRLKNSLLGYIHNSDAGSEARIKELIKKIENEYF